MKAVLRSIKPYYFYLICEGLKTVEVGKTAPRSEDWNRSVELYCSKDMKSFKRIPKEFQDKYRPFLGKVGAKFVCDFFEEFSGGIGIGFKRFRAFAETCLTVQEMQEYLKGKNGYGWHISELKIYDTPKELGEFLTPSGTGGVWGNHYITRPPQSWFYVEEIER